MSQLSRKESLESQVERLSKSLEEVNEKNKEALALLETKTKAHAELVALGQKSPVTDVSLKPVVEKMGENLKGIYEILNQQKQALKVGMEQAAKVTMGFRK